jgi:tRNA-specific 2-thiouridylase
MFEEGELVDSSGKVVGRHGGVAGFTVGQRRGLNFAAGKPMFVLKLEPTSNRVIIGEGDELLEKEVELQDVFWSQPVEEKLTVDAKIRYNMNPERAVIYSGDKPRLVFKQPVRAVSPGQIAVAYKGETVIAGGTICSK